MSKQDVKMMDLTLQEKKELAQQIITVINDEIANANGVFGGYSNDPFTKVAIQEVKMKSLCTKMQMVLAGSPYCMITGNLIFARSTASGVVLQNAYVGSRFIFNNINPGTIEHELMSLDIPFDQLEANSVFSAPESGTYAYIQLTGVYHLVDIPEEGDVKSEKVVEETPVEEDTTVNE